MVALAWQRPSLLLEEKVSPVRTLGRRGRLRNCKTGAMTPSQSKIGSEEPIFASSPKGRAKSACGANSSTN